MGNVSRAYVYLACFASLQAVAWATISLLRNLLTSGSFASPEDTALQIAVVIVGLPIYLIHWLWAQRAARRHSHEQGVTLRRVYLYGAMASFLGPFLANAVDLLEALLRGASDLRLVSDRFWGLSRPGAIAHSLAAMFVLAILWYYHLHIVRSDERAVPATGRLATVRRVYVYACSAVGLLLTAVAVVDLVQWLIHLLRGGTITTHYGGLLGAVARAAVGLPLWLTSWAWAQRLFASSAQGERASVLRKVYLYLVVFLSVLATVTTLTIVLADALSRVLGAPHSGSGDIGEAISILLTVGPVWGYHAYILRQDAALASSPRTAAWVRQVYLYLVAAIGLGALLIGIAGDLTLLIRYLAGASFVGGIPEEAAWFTALVFVGLPVWILPWRRAQLAAEVPGQAGDEESTSLARKIYLYFYLTLATMTLLASGVYVVSRLVGLLLGVGQPGNLLADIGQAVAYSLLAIGIWVYHSTVLRADDQRTKAVQAESLTSTQVALLDIPGSTLSRNLIAALDSELPGLDVLIVEPSGANTPAVLREVDLIIVPASVVLSDATTARSIAASHARKLVLVNLDEEWHLAGVEDVSAHESIQGAVHAVKRFAAGDAIGARRGLSPGSVVGILVAGLFLLVGLAGLLLYLFAIETYQ